jgi:hypothetical protein
MKIRSLLLALSLCALLTVALVPAASAASGGSGFIPVAPQQLNVGTTTGTLTSVKITSIANQSGQMVASGLATVTMASGATAIGSFTNAPLAASPIPTGPGTCPILHLDIGPISLNLLGLVVTVPQDIIVDITAVSGPGNLLGNLLCAVANLLNQTPPPLNQIVTLLNQILALL